MNLYLGGRGATPPVSRRYPAQIPGDAGEDSVVAINRAVDYLARVRNGDGSWHDYQLPVGRATEWVTAFAGVALAEAGKHHHKAQRLAREAAEWIASARAYECGWGYNRKTGPDADSTGFALRLLGACGIAAREGDQAWLLRQWRNEGGFATYGGPRCWGDAHPCVTAAAFLALPDEQRRALLPALLSYVRSTRRDDGTWPTYWWRSHHYSTYHHLRLLRALGVSDETTIEAGDAANAFQLAYAVGIEHQAGQRVRRDAALARLLAMQQDDGSFPGAANLRVTDPDCARPWESPRGALYADERSTLTTASAIFTLSEVAYANQ